MAMIINYSALCYVINFMIWSGLITVPKYFTSCMEWCLVIDRILSSKRRQAYIPLGVYLYVLANLIYSKEA